MSRVGWAAVAVLALAVVALLSVTSFGVAGRRAAAPPVVAEAPGALVVPVRGVARADLRDDWGDPRGGGARSHHGIDIPAPGGQPVVAAAAGTVEKLFRSELGGTTLYLRSADRRWTYYYAHLSGYAAGVREGLGVRPGQVLGYVGDTGDAGAGNYHLHFSTTRTAPEQGWWQGEDVDPYPILARPNLAGGRHGG